MSEKTVYLLAGGPSSNPEWMIGDFRTVFQACGKLNPDIAYIGTANRESQAFFQRTQELLLAAGAQKVILVPVLGGQANLEESKRILSEADAVFLSGGEVEDGISGLRNSGLDVFLTKLYRGGKQFFGTSAGAIMMGRYWVHWDVENDDDTSSLFECLNFVPMTFDAHGENEDWRELKCALRLLGPGEEGYGLSDGGFYSSDTHGTLRAFRNGPKVFQNTGKEIGLKAGGYEDEQ